MIGINLEKDIEVFKSGNALFLFLGILLLFIERYHINNYYNFKYDNLFLIILWIYVISNSFFYIKI